MNKDLFKTKDKQIAPFLLVCPEVEFIGVEQEGSILYFKFSPLDKCLSLVNKYMSRQAPLVQPKDILDAVETFRDRVFEMKDERRNYEEERFYPTSK